MRRPIFLAGTAALALLAAGAAVWLGRDELPSGSPLPSAANAGPRGLAALHEWLAATGRGALLVGGPREAPRDAVYLLAVPTAPLSDEEVEAVLARAGRGGLVVWAVGPTGTQPALEARLQVARPPGQWEPESAASLASHPLFDGLTLSTSGASVASGAPGARAVAGGPGFAAAVAVPVGSGEVLLLAGADLGENRRIARLGNLAFWVRLASRGPIAFDEGHWPGAGERARGRGGAWLAIAQALLAAAAFFWAGGRRLGEVRPPQPPAAARTAADYLASLAALYRRARAERELGAAAWEGFRLRLQRRAGVPAGLPDEEAAARLEFLAPVAAAALRRGAAVAGRGATGTGDVVLLVRAAAEAEAALERRPVR